MEMTALLCWVCGDKMYDDDAASCDACGNPAHVGCLSEEHEDGRLCADCGVECPWCDMAIVRDFSVSNHIEKDANGMYCCPVESTSEVDTHGE
jgi:hypothetical protein